MLVRGALLKTMSVVSAPLLRTHLSHYLWHHQASSGFVLNRRNDDFSAATFRRGGRNDRAHSNDEVNEVLTGYFVTIWTSSLLDIKLIGR